MPLSENEQRLLDQMERALYAEDPKFATSMRNPHPLAGDKRRIALGVVGVLVGLGLLVGGVATKLVPMGVLGFLAMLGGIWLAITAVKPSDPALKSMPTGPNAAGRSTRAGGLDTRRPRSSRPRANQRRSPSGESLTERMERRWRHRRQTGNF